MLSTFLSQIVNGVVFGSLIGLIALGYTMVYGIIQLINFAHGEIFMVGAYGALAMFTYVLPTAWQAAVVHRPAARADRGRRVSVLVAVAMERFAYRPLRGAPRLAPLITALGVSVALQEAVRIFYPNGTLGAAIPERLHRGHLVIPIGDGVPIRYAGILLVVVSLGLGYLLDSFVERTRMGRAMRATSQDPDVARLMGIDPDRVIVLTFVLGAALAGVGGVLYGNYLNNINIDIGFQNGIFAFTAAVLGGIGNIRGAIVGGLAIGLDQVPRGPVPSRWDGLRLRLDLRGAHRRCWCSGRRASSARPSGCGHDRPAGARRHGAAHRGRRC